MRIPKTVLIAPDSFKGTLSAPEVARAVGDGLQAAGHPVELCPVADGGEGTLAVLTGALGGERRSATASTHWAARSRPRSGSAGWAESVGVVETATASGLGLVRARERAPVAASTYGTGELIMAALDAGADEVYLGVGGAPRPTGARGP